MRKTLLLIIIISLNIQAQVDSLNIKKATYKSILIDDNKLLSVDNNGILNIWNLDNFKKNYRSKNINTFFTSIAKDKKGQFYIGTKKGRVLKFNINDYSITTFLKLKKTFWTVHNMYFNSKNEMFLVLPFGIYSTSNKKLWTEFEHKGVLMTVYVKRKLWFNKRLEKYFSLPEYTYYDNKGILWMTKTFGEFGSVLQLFDTENKKIITENDSLHCSDTKSLFTDNKNRLFETYGLMHFGQSGGISIIKNYKTIKSINSKKFKNEKNEILFEHEIFIGPGTFNKWNNKYYFSTTKGFYEAKYINDEFVNFKFLFQPKLIWKHEPLAIGVDMAIKRIEFINKNTMIFLTSNNGIGIYNGKIIWLE